MDYPATFEFNAPEKVARWRVIGNLILSIPHIIVVYLLGIVGTVIDILSWIVIVLTGKLPAGLAGVSCMLIRYQTRVGAFIVFMRSSYPPFDFDTSTQDNGKDPEVVVNFEPELEGRSRLSVFFRFILLIPVVIVGMLWGDSGGAGCNCCFLRRAHPRPLAQRAAQFHSWGQPLQRPHKRLLVPPYRQIPSSGPELTS